MRRAAPVVAAVAAAGATIAGLIALHVTRGDGGDGGDGAIERALPAPMPLPVTDARLGAQTMGWPRPTNLTSIEPRPASLTAVEPPPIGSITAPAHALAPAVRLNPPPIRTMPGAHLLQLTRTMPAPATTASDPAAFEAMHHADGLGFAAGDGTISIALPDGRSLWLYGDTMMHLPSASGGVRRSADMVRNSAVLQDGTQLTTLTTGTAQDADDFLKPPGEPDRWYWPGHGIAEDDELIVFMGRVRKTEGGAPGWNFTGDGSDMVRMSLSDLSVREVRRMPGGENMTWGASVISDETHTYIYGMESGPGPFDRYAHVARAAKGHVGDGAFEYWDGGAGTPDASRSARFGDGVASQFTVMQTPAGRWAMVTQDVFFTTGLNVRTADSPQGPWSEARQIDPGPALNSNQISYNAMAHPQFNADGKLLVGWNLNRSDGQLPTTDQLEDYRPKFRAVDLVILDA